MPEIPTPRDYDIQRLTQEAYKQLTAQLPKLGNPKDGIEAAFLLGVQTVLTKLRDGFTVERA